MDFKMSKFDIDRIACLMYRDIAAYIDDQRKQSSDCDAAARKEEKQYAFEPVSYTHLKCLPRDGCHAVFRFVTSKLTTACFSSEF